jgi:hypothetical protein
VPQPRGEVCGSDDEINPSVGLLLHEGDGPRRRRGCPGCRPW